MDHPRSWMRYVDAADLNAGAIDFDGLDVEAASGAELGDVDGFIIDVNSGRPYYIVVDAGGWFRTKSYLLPVGHARLDSRRKVLVADLTRDRIEQFPGFDKDEFERLSDDELNRFGAATAAACCETDDQPDKPFGAQLHYRKPEWWETGFYDPEGMVASDSSSRDRR
jgi:PRC-barrel domain